MCQTDGKEVAARLEKKSGVLVGIARRMAWLILQSPAQANDLRSFLADSQRHRPEYPLLLLQSFGFVNVELGSHRCPFHMHAIQRQMSEAEAVATHE